MPGRVSDDRLVGGPGADRLVGNSGNEVYFTDADDTIEDTWGIPTLGDGSHVAAQEGDLVRWYAASPEFGAVFELVSAPAGAAIDPYTGEFTWLANEDGQFVVQVAATSDHGTTSQQMVLNILDVPPRIVTDGASSVTEGVDYLLELVAVTDPGLDAVTAYSIDWGDGTPVEHFTVAEHGEPTGKLLAHRYADGPREYVMHVHLADEDGQYPNVATRTVLVTNAAPTVALSGDPSVDEGAPYTLILGPITDPGTDTVTQYIVDWGDGTSQTYTSAGPRTHTYLDDIEHVTIRVALVDEDGTHENAGTLDVMVRNVVPTIAISGAASVDEGALYTLALGSITDPGVDTVVAIWVNWGDGTVEPAFSNSALTHIFDDNASDVLIRVDLVDEDGTHTGAGMLPIDVRNVAPSAVFEAPDTVDAGEVVQLALTSPTDPSAADIAAGFQYAFDLGDGYGEFGPLATAGRVISDDGVLEVGAKIRDKDGGVREYRQPLTVLNGVPVVSAGDDQITYEGEVVSFTGTVGDPGLLDAYSIAWDFGDGTTTAGSLTPSHTYANPGSYQVTLSVTDNNGRVGSDTLMVTVHALMRVEFIAPDSSVGEAAGLHDVLIRLIADPDTSLSAPITVTVAVMLNGTAESGSDYSAFGTQSVTFGVNSIHDDTQHVTLQLNNDLLLEGDEHLALKITGVTGPRVTPGTSLDHEVTIVDDERVSVEFSAVTSSVGEAAGRTTCKCGSWLIRG